MIFVGLLSRVGVHPGLMTDGQIKPNSREYKHAKFVAHDDPIFTHGGMYIVEQKIDKKKSNLYLGLTILGLFSLIFYD